MARKEPQNIDAEISVLGCGFLDNKEALDKIMDEVTDDMLLRENDLLNAENKQLELGYKYLKEEVKYQNLWKGKYLDRINKAISYIKNISSYDEECKMCFDELNGNEIIRLLEILGGNNEE